MSDLHVTLRTEGDSPARKGAAVGLGTLIGCVPLYGAHLILCASLARLFRLNRLTTYLAAHINNPFTAPILLFLAFGVGHRVTRGRWPPLELARLAQSGLLGLGRDAIVGSLLLGVVLGAILGLIAYLAGRRAAHAPEWNRLIEETGRRYLASGVSHWEFVRGKLRHDPLYRTLHRRLQSVPATKLLDLGCGRGIALAVAAAAWGSTRAAGAGSQAGLVGIERRPELVRVARLALAGDALIEAADLATCEPPAAGIVLLLDVLHHLEPAAQERLLAGVARSLRPGGFILIREPDADLGMRFRITKIVNAAFAIVRRDGRQGFHYRGSREWAWQLGAIGLTASSRPLSRGTPFANVLIEARPADSQSNPSD